MARYRCEKCQRQKDEKLFYTYKGGEGKKCELCKDCLTMHLDAYKPETYIWLCEKFDIPYLSPEWNNVRDKEYQKKGPTKFDHKTVFGKYLMRMKLNQFYKYGFADSQKLMQDRYNKGGDGDPIPTEEEERNAAYELAKKLDEQLADGTISEGEYNLMLPGFIKAERGLTAKAQNKNNREQIPEGSYSFFDESKFEVKQEELPDPAADLTKEDKLYLAMKWGTTYTPAEWLTMERNYHNMEESFDIQDADSKNTLKLICKTDLKMNNAIDMGDFDGYNKLSRVSDQLRKSAKFTAAQNKKEKGEFVDSIGQLVEYCEREGGFIPRYCTDIPQDKVDFTLQDMQKYVYNLVTEDLGFGQQIELYLKKIALEQEEEKRITELDDIAVKNGENIINDDVFEEVLEDADIAKYYEEEDKDREQTVRQMESSEQKDVFSDYAARVEKMKQKELQFGGKK